MSYHPEDASMDVYVGGKLERRPVEYTERLEREMYAGQRHYFVMHYPELNEGEGCEWTLGSDVPRIVKAQP
jgi:hypothetical protein